MRLGFEYRKVIAEEERAYGEIWGYTFRYCIEVWHDGKSVDEIEWPSF